MVDSSAVGYAPSVKRLIQSAMLNRKKEQRHVRGIVIAAESMFALLLLTSARDVHLCPTAYISLRRFM